MQALSTGTVTGRAVRVPSRKIADCNICVFAALVYKFNARSSFGKFKSTLPCAVRLSFEFYFFCACNDVPVVFDCSKRNCLGILVEGYVPLACGKKVSFNVFAVNPYR